MNRIAVLFSSPVDIIHIDILERDDLEFVFIQCDDDSYLDKVCGAVFAGMIIIHPVEQQAINYFRSRVRK